ncbi:YbjQ family protein [Microlunatus soli]|uniref:UPF0145 protein SAMN04489812_2191 n=1 Tax=Microlunatus soli TaxID=630515 RepID=A0A1H1SYQ2_9ACTN|nr:YbjQ family protein [Microlunatus soli]SDS53122.1 Uncharacterized conserved protein YbjQ, UPF0145 family [Microlunatus soli]
MIIVTTNEVPGYAIEAVLGEVMGMTVRSANFGANFSASFRAIGGGEVTEYTQLVYESRNEVMNRMWSEAQRRGANAIIGMRFDTGDIGQAFTEICAYGTAVVARPLGEGEQGATPQSIQQAGQRPSQPGQHQPNRPQPGPQGGQGFGRPQPGRPGFGGPPPMPQGGPPAPQPSGPAAPPPQGGPGAPPQGAPTARPHGGPAAQPQSPWQPVPPGTAQQPPNPARPEPARPEPARPEPARPEPSTAESSQYQARQDRGDETRAGREDPTQPPSGSSSAAAQQSAEPMPRPDAHGYSPQIPPPQDRP